MAVPVREFALRHRATASLTLARLVAVALSAGVVAWQGGPWLRAAAAWLGGAWALAVLLAHWRGRAPGVLRIDADGITLPTFPLGRTRQFAWRTLRFGTAYTAGAAGLLRLAFAGTPFAVVLRDADFAQPDALAALLAEVRAKAPAGRFEAMADAPTRPPWFTGAIVLSLVLAQVFAVALAPATWADYPVLGLLRLGAFEAGLVQAGDLHRLGTYALPHAGTLHLLLNGLLLLGLGGALEARNGWRFAAGLYGFATLVAGAAMFVLPAAGLAYGASGTAYGAVGALLAATAFAPALAPPMFRLLPPWLLALFVLLDLAFAAASPRIAFTAHLAGLVAGALFTVVHARAPRPAANALALVALLAWAATFVALAVQDARTPMLALAQRALAADVDAETALDAAGYAADTPSTDATTLARAFALLSDPARPGQDRIGEGSAGVRREDVLARLAWRRDMLGEARAHGLDAVRRADEEGADLRGTLLARLATYEAAARLPPFVPAAILVRANTLCAIVPAGNPRQYLRAVIGVDGRTQGLLLGTVEPRETRCIAAPGVPARAHVALTASEPAGLSADLHYHPVDMARARLPARSTHPLTAPSSSTSTTTTSSTSTPSRATPGPSRPRDPAP